MKTQITDEMVSRFLAWSVPRHFYPDCYITFDREKASQSPHSWPTGTNLLTAEQARAMLEHVIGKQYEPHEQRVLDEKAELDTKATALSNFIGLSPVFAKLDPAEQERLKEQCEVMHQYREILGARIAAFG